MCVISNKNKCFISTNVNSVNELNDRFLMRLSIAGHVSLTKLRSFSDASRSKRSADCEKDDTSRRSGREVETKKDYSAYSQEVAKSRCRIEEKICEKSRRKDTCDSSQDNASEKRLERKSKPCKSYMCPELKRQKPCSRNEERCPEPRQKSNAKGRNSSRDRARQLRDSDCSQKKDIDTRYSKSNVERHNRCSNSI